MSSEIIQMKNETMALNKSNNFLTANVIACCIAGTSSIAIAQVANPAQNNPAQNNTTQNNPGPALPALPATPSIDTVPMIFLVWIVLGWILGWIDRLPQSDRACACDAACNHICCQKVVQFFWCHSFVFHLNNFAAHSFVN